MGVIPLGPFDLASPVGRGGMGEVWAAIHRDQQVPVAIKVLTSESAQHPAFHQAFRNEVRAVARLDHPGIVVVYDHGIIPPEAEAASEGRLPAGSPYLAMERATGGTLHAACGAVDWGSLRLLLLALLDAE
jgi:serine/threonine-protein kinase